MKVTFAVLLTAFGLIFASPSSLLADDTPECAPKDHQECLALSHSYEKGTWPFPKDREKALEFGRQGLAALSASCMSGSRFSCDRLVRVSSLLEWIPPSETLQFVGLAKTKLERLCDTGSIWSCVLRSDNAPRFGRLGLLGSDATDINFADDDPRLWQEKALNTAKITLQSNKQDCANGSLEACVARFEGSFFTQDTEILREITQTDYWGFCTAPATESCSSILEALLSFEMRWHSLSAKLAATYATGCEQGFAKMCFWSGNRALVQINLDAAAAFWKLGCDLGGASSCKALGEQELRQWKFQSENDAKLLANGTLHYQQACDLGSISACHALVHITNL
ncbi:hypothetical protein [Pseudophaeobacter sp.]|uniref:hypothetical protein n=1 Tax=Pseudophaeobacter sp. TaxID=1971739 RepID=UPI003299A91A